MKRNFVIILLALFLLASCISAFAGAVGTTDEEIKTVAEPILDNMLTALKDNNYDQYSKDFGADMLQIMPKEKFDKMKADMFDALGNYQSRKYMGYIEKGGETIVFWKSDFDKTNDDVVIQLFISRKGDKCLVEGILFE